VKITKLKSTKLQMEAHSIYQAHNIGKKEINDNVINLKKLKNKI
jgi:hypothetical protein